MVKHCIVAALHFTIETEDMELLGAMARRYAPFSRRSADCEEIPLLFSIKTVAPFAPLAGAKEMARFDCEGAECVYEQTDEMVSITLRNAEADETLASMQCDINYHKAECWLSGDLWRREYCINNFMMMLFAFSSMDKQTLLFHASVTANAGKAYLFLGKSGTGKSTHTNLWLKYIPGSELVNDDNPAVGVRDGQVIVYGTPWSGKTPCYRNVQFPVGAFVRLHQEKENKMSREGVVQSFASLLPSCSGVKWDVRLYRAQGDTICKVVSQVPVFELGCLPDEGAAVLCHDTVTSSAK